MESRAGHGGWSPPHCPNPKCRYHKQFEDSWRWRKRGFYRRRGVRCPIQRYECLTCGRTFSSQTFRVDYWLKCPERLPEVFMRLVGCMCARQIARDLGCSPETVHRLIARLGRHCMLFHLDRWKGRPPEGPLVVDGFESFEYSQYHPIHHHLAVEAETGFWLYHTDSELRRKGRMTSYQKKRRKQIEEKVGRPDPQAIRKDMGELLRVCLQKASRALVRSDEHRSYPAALRTVPCPVRHEVTHSRRPRNPQNPLFVVNELDLLIRHSQANHKRETIAFSKRRQGSAERLSILLVWRNYMKWRREKKPGVTAAMLKGICQERLPLSRILHKRLFPSRIPLPERWKLYYHRRVFTREIPHNRTHDLRYAF